MFILLVANLNCLLKRLYPVDDGGKVISTQMVLHMSAKPISDLWNTVTNCKSFEVAVREGNQAQILYSPSEWTQHP